MILLRKIIFIAVNNGLLQRDPFFAYKYHEGGDQTELSDQRENQTPDQPHIQKEKLWTDPQPIHFLHLYGIEWTDMANLTKANLRTSFDGHLWIDTNRQKTGIETNIWLLDVAKHIIEKYDSMAERNKLLPVPCYVNCKNSIKAIAKKCGIEKNVTWHQRRHLMYLSAILSWQGD